MAEWSEEDYKHDVAHSGREYVKLPTEYIEALNRCVWYRDGDYAEKHSVHGISFDAEELNGGGRH